MCVCVCVLLLQDLLQSCARGGRRVEDMCYDPEAVTVLQTSKTVTKSSACSPPKIPSPRETRESIVGVRRPRVGAKDAEPDNTVVGAHCSDSADKGARSVACVLRQCATHSVDHAFQPMLWLHGSRHQGRQAWSSSPADASEHRQRPDANARASAVFFCRGHGREIAAD